MCETIDNSIFPVGINTVYIVAEAEINHNGDLDTALRMIDVAVDSRADAIKFQYIVAEEIAEKGSSYYELFKNVELQFDEFVTLNNYANQGGIDFFLTVPSLNVLAFVVDINPRFLKIGSTNITNLPLLASVGRTGLPVILSTGMATLGEIETALNILGDTQTALLHCTVSYPAAMETLNLRAINTMIKAFPGHLVGYSDHSEGIAAAVAAVTLGARIVEKHFTLDRTQNGPDHCFSIDPPGLKHFVEAVRGVESGLGNGAKCPSETETSMLAGARRYLVAARYIGPGQVIQEKDIVCKRIEFKEGAVTASDYYVALGMRVKIALAKGDIIEWSNLKG